MSRRRRSTPVTELNLTPLIDMIFMLVLFFMVTASFVKMRSMDLELPQAATAQPNDPGLVIVVDADNVLWVEERTIDIRALKPWLVRYLSSKPDREIVVAADARARNGIVVQTLDVCKAAGAKRLGVATRNAP